MTFIICTLLIVTSTYSKNNIATEQITISHQLKEQILQSPFKALLKTKDGHQFMAYLFAEDEKKIRDEPYPGITGDLRSSVRRKGHYFVYLYDLSHDSFLPYKTPILRDSKALNFNTQGSRIIVLPGSQENKSDVLLISQFWYHDGDLYEAYGFLENKPYLQNYMFLSKSKERQFLGKITESDNKTNSQLSGWGTEYGATFLSLSDKPGIILVKPKNPD